MDELRGWWQYVIKGPSTLGGGEKAEQKVQKAMHVDMDLTPPVLKKFLMRPDIGMEKATAEKYVDDLWTIYKYYYGLDAVPELNGYDLRSSGKWPALNASYDTSHGRME